MPGDPGTFISGALRHEDVDVAREYGTAMCTVWSLVNVGARTLQSRGSGFLVRCAGQACILTNAHVLPNREALERSSVKFITPVSGCSSVVTLCPEKFFMTSPKPRPDTCACKFEICTCPFAAKASALALDYTVCGITAEGLHMRKSVPVPFNGTKPLPGYGIYFVHQIGEHLKCSKEQIEVADEFRILSMSASFPGSSGSPVFNLDRELIGLHRAGGCKANISMEVSNAGIGKVVAPCLAVPTRAIARNMRLQMMIHDILEDMLYSFLADGEESEGSPVDRESSSEEEKEIAHYAPVNNLSLQPKQPRYLLAKWGFEIFYEKSKTTGGQITVTRLVPDTQAAERLEVGDILHSVNGVAIADLEMVLILTYLQLSKLLLGIDRLSPSSGFLMLLTNRRRAQVILDTPELSRFGTVHSSSQDPRASVPSAPAMLPSAGDELGLLGQINTEEMLQQAVQGAASFLQIPVRGGNQAGEPGAAGESAETGSEEGGAAVGDAGEGGVTSAEAEGGAGAEAEGDASGRAAEGGGAVEAGADEVSQSQVVVDAYGGPCYIVERLGLQLGKGSPGRLKVTKVGKRSWCRQLMRKGDELLAIGGRGLRGMKIACVLELLNREGVKVMVCRERADPELETADEVWTVDLTAPAVGAAVAKESAPRRCRKQGRRSNRWREYMHTRPGQSPAVWNADERAAGSGVADAVVGGPGAEDARHVIKRWGLELEKKQPGRLRVRKVWEDSMARKQVREGDEILAVNRRSLKGMRIADVLEALSVGLLTLALERNGNGVVVELHALKLAAQSAARQRATSSANANAAPEPEPEPEPEPASGMIFAGAIGDIIQRASTDTARIAGSNVPALATAKNGAVPPPAPPPPRISVERWGLELERGVQPGRLRVCAMRKDSAAHGKLLVGDVLLELNKRTLKGMVVADVLEMLGWARPVVELERSVKRAALVDYWQKEQLTVRLGPPEPPKPRFQEADAQGAVKEVLRRLVASVVKDLALTYAVQRWGLELGRGSPGRLRVLRLAAAGIARRHLKEGDEVMALDGKELKGMRVAQVLALLDRPRVAVLIDRRSGAALHESVRVELSEPESGTVKELRREEDAKAGGKEDCGVGVSATAGAAVGDGGQAQSGHDDSEIGNAQSGHAECDAEFRFAEGVQALRKPLEEPAVGTVAVPIEQEFDAAVSAMELLTELSGYAVMLAQRRQGVSGELKATRWGLELARGQPGRLTVCRVRSRTSLAFGKVFEADHIVEVNGQSMKGMKLADVLALLEATRVMLKVERAVAGRGADYWQASEVLVQLVDSHAELAARRLALQVAADVVDMVVDKALNVHNRRFVVEGWGIVLKRGAPGRLRVTLVREDSAALGKLFEGDDIVAIGGAALGSMQVQDAVDQLEGESLNLTVARVKEGSDSDDARIKLEVELQGYLRRFKASPNRILASAIEGMCNVRGASTPKDGAGTGPGTPRGLKHVIERWGMVLGKGSPGCLRVTSISPESLVSGRIREGDEIVAVDGKGFRGMKMAQVLELLRREQSVVQVMRLDGERHQTLRVELSTAPRTSTPPEPAVQEVDEGPSVAPPLRVSESEHAAGDIVGAVVEHAAAIASTRSELQGPRAALGPEESFRVDRWGLELARGGPGRMKVLKIGNESLARGVLRVGDMVLMVNGQGFKGKTIADVLKTMHAQSLRVMVDRESGGRWALETLYLEGGRPRQAVVRVRVKPHQPRAAMQAPLSPSKVALDGAHWIAEHSRSETPGDIARDVIVDIVEGIVLVHKVGRWGLELRRASPGKLKVCTVQHNALAFGKLRSNDEIVAVNARSLRGMKVCEVLDALDEERVVVTVERVEAGTQWPAVKEVELRSQQSLTAIVKLSIDTFNRINQPRSAAGQRVADATREKLEAVASVIDDMLDAAVVRYSVRLWGLQVRRGTPGRLTVSRVEPDGLAAGQLAVGDEIAAVNGRAMKGTTVSEAMALMGSSQLVLTVERKNDGGVLHTVLNLKVPPSHTETRETREDKKAVSEKGPTAVGAFFDGFVQRFSETTAQFAAAAAPAAAKPAAPSLAKSGESEVDTKEAASAVDKDSDAREQEGDRAAPRQKDEQRAAPRSYFGEGLQLLRSSPGILTVKKPPHCAGWEDLLDGDEIVAMGGETLNGVKTSQVREAMLTQAPTLVVHRRILNPPGTTFWKWMLPAQVLTIRLPAVEAE